MPVKIDRQIAEEIRTLVREGMTQKEASYRFGLAKSTVSMIVANKIWSNHEDPDHHHRAVAVDHSGDSPPEPRQHADEVMPRARLAASLPLKEQRP
jgi:hypothetical protein